ncbi:MAG: inositol monophosphatase family protein [Actinomycetota bacterium]
MTILLEELRSLAIELAWRAAEIQRDGLRDGFEIAEKSASGDLVTGIDRACERAIVDGILAARPDDAIVGEEGTDRPGSSGVRWVIDPLDGTASYVRGYPGYAVSIGVEVDAHPSVGVVVDALGRLTVGVTGHGTERDGRPTRPSERTTIHDAVLATGFGYDERMRVLQARWLTEVIGRVADIRRSGSAAMDLCSVACGEVDAYYELHLAPWDTAAGRVAVEAAGGEFRQIDQPDGEVLTVAAPMRLLEPLLGLLGDAGLAVGR